jgi:hypothetical protein
VIKSGSVNRVSSRTSRARSVEKPATTPRTSKRVTAASVTGGLAERTCSLPDWNHGQQSMPSNVRCPQDAHFIPPSSKLLCSCFSGSNPYQTTHWYDTVMGYTACPWQAALGGTSWMDIMIWRVEEVGTHCCSTQGCEVIHRGSAQHFLALLARYEAGTK